MSVFAAMNAAVSGLGAQARKMGHISDNIANVSTIAYKKITTDFSTMVTQSGRRTHSPGGVTSAPYYNIGLQGQMQASAKSTHMGINGDGFFIVRNYPDDAETQGLNRKNFYTRKGDFNIDAQGNLVNSSGYYLMGRAYDITTDSLMAGDLQSVNVANMAGIATPTAHVRVGANLPAESATQPIVHDLGNLGAVSVAATDYEVSVNGTTLVVTGDGVTEVGELVEAAINANATLQGLGISSAWSTTTNVLQVTGPSDGSALTILDNPSGLNTATGYTETTAIVPAYGSAEHFTEQTLYDAQGQAQTIRLEYIKTGTNQWNMRAVQADTSGTWRMISGGEVTLTFNVDGTISSTTPPTSVPAAGAQGEQMVWDASTGRFQLTPPVGSNWTWQWDQSEPIEFNIGEPDSPIGITQYSSEFSVTDLTQDGLPYGQFTGVSIDEYGDVYAQYGNGATIRIYHLPLAIFTNADGLQNVDGNAYEATAFSGDPSVLSPGVGRGGKVISEALEGSSVDLAEEFTQMIQTQRAYSANSRVISTADQMTEEIIRIKS